MKNSIYRAERFVEGSVAPAYLGGVVPDHWNQIGNAEYNHDIIIRWAHWWAEKFPDDRVRIAHTVTETTYEDVSDGRQVG